MDYYTRFARRILFPIGDSLRGIPIERERKYYEQTQWWSKDAIRELQNERLRKIIKFVYENNPYYQALMRERNLSYKDFDTIDHLYKLPILTKEDIKTNSLKLKSGIFDKKAVRAATGGSTGEPLTYWHDRATQACNRALHRRGLSWSGFEVGDPLIVIMAGAFGSNRDRIIEAIRGQITKQHQIPASVIYRKAIPEIVKRIQRVSPKGLIGYASNLWWLASLIEQANIKIEIPIVFTTSETLLPPYRSKIEKVFSSRVYDYYGLGEIQALAYQCQHASYHFSEEKTVVECIPLISSNPKICQLILTDLSNYSFPLLRYQTGDIVELSDDSCVCGRNLLTVKRIIGRLGDLLIFQSGQILTSPFISVLFRQFSTISEYQIIQEDTRKLLINVVKKEECREIAFRKDLLKINNWLQEYGENEIQIEFKVLPTIERTGAGKLRTTISQIPNASIFNLFQDEAYQEISQLLI